MEERNEESIMSPELFLGLLFAGLGIAIVLMAYVLHLIECEKRGRPNKESKENWYIDHTIEQKEKEQ